MSREPLAAFNIANDATGASACDVLVVTFADGRLFHLGMDEVEIAGQVYVLAVDDAGEWRQSEGSAPDGATVILFRTAEDWCEQNTNGDFRIEAAEVVCYRAVLTSAGTWVTDELGRGIVRGVTPQDGLLSLRVVSELSDTEATIGGEELTQRCPLPFPGCGWQPSMGGDPTFCSREKEAADGCSGHGFEYAFGGTPQKLTQEQRAVLEAAVRPTDDLSNGWRGDEGPTITDPRLDRGYLPIM